MDRAKSEEERLERVVFDEEMRAAGFRRDPDSGAWVDGDRRRGR